MDSTEYIIKDVKNYNKHLKEKNARILNYYNNIIFEYIKNIKDNVNIKKIELMHFITGRGIHVINHIFSIMLLYTKNIDITVRHTTQGFLYYTEFISQIGDDIHSYLQLNSKDAMLFSYKKTIYDIDNDYKKKFKLCMKDKKKINEITILCEITNKIMYNLINCPRFICDMKTDNFLPKLKNILDTFRINSQLILENKLEDIINKFLEIINKHEDTDHNQQLSITHNFLKKIFKRIRLHTNKNTKSKVVIKEINKQIMDNLNYFSNNNSIDNYLSKKSENSLINSFLSIKTSNVIV